jgi:hypothetical protein
LGTSTGTGTGLPPDLTSDFECQKLKNLVQTLQQMSCAQFLNNNIGTPSEIKSAINSEPSCSSAEKSSMIAAINAKLLQCQQQGQNETNTEGFALPTNLIWIGAAALVFLLVMKR